MSLVIPKKYRFENKSNSLTKRLRIYVNKQYSLSVIQGLYTYGNDEGLYEVAVMNNDCLDYDTPITDDVIGYCTKEDVLKYLNQLDKWVLEQELISHEADLLNHVNDHNATECIRASMDTIYGQLEDLNKE